ncbi:EAL domain-containing protein [bacterium]|nr:EAL domain-containing protein [bacterium]
MEEAFSLWDVAPQRLTLEITEDVLIKDKELAFDYLSKLRETGVRISIDDFGTGYSSLAYFKHIPADELKIDRAFIGSMLTDQGSKNIVKLIIDLAHSFNLDVVAEGVEDQATLDELTRMQCDYAQGFFIGKPMPADEYTEWLKTTAVK